MYNYIGLIGTNGAGKSSVCEFLSQHGYNVVSLSDILRDEVKQKGLEATRDNLVATGNELKENFGQNVLAVKVFEKAEKDKTKKFVFDSIRNISEVNFLKEKNVFFLGIDAPVNIRYERIKKRNKATDNIDYETFIKQDERENKGLSSGQHIEAALKLCSVIINNESTLENLHKKIETILLD